MSRGGLSDGATRVVGLSRAIDGEGRCDGDVYVSTAVSGTSYQIERIYLDSDQAYGFAQDSNGIAPDPGGRRLVC